jgi:nucleoside-diphosphate-sugar epimerase
VASVDTELPFYEADVREPGALDEASQGVDIIIHTPAYHGIHSGKRSEQEFYDLNVTGTFQMFQSAVRNRVRRVVWLSSMSFYGSSFYSYTKKMGEHLCEFYHERHGIEVITLRPADFTPFRDLLHYGERMLHGGVDRRDVLQAIVQAVTCPTSYGFNQINRQYPFPEEDLKAYPESPIEVWDKAYPGAGELVRKHDFKLPNQIRDRF